MLIPPPHEYYVPAPRQVQYARGSVPGDLDGANYGAAADTATNTIYFNGPQLARSTKGHETAHILDAQVLTDGQRQFFTHLMGLSGAWDQGTGYSGMKSPKEFFADWYGNAANNHDGVHRWDSAYAPPPDPKAYKRFRQALERLARRQQLGRYAR